MNIVNELFIAGLIPLAIAAASAFILRQMRAPPPVAWATGAAMGYVAGHLAVASRRGIAQGIQAILFPREAADWLPLASLVALGVAILGAYAPRRWRRMVVGLAVLLTIGVPARLLAGHIAQQWSALEKISHLTLLASMLTLVWLLLATERDDELPRLRQLLLIGAALGAAVVMTLSGSFSIGRLCGVAAAALTGAALASPRGTAGAAGVVAVVLGGLVIVGVFYASLSAANATLLLLSVAAAAGRLPERISRPSSGQRAFIRTALALLPLAVAIAACFA